MDYFRVYNKQKMRTKIVIYVIATLFLGGHMIYGGIGKFKGSTPAPTDKIDQLEEIGFKEARASDHLVLSNFVFGLKQTGYFWAFLGVSELLVGLLLISQRFSLIGAIMSVPITLNIFLFHVFLEFDEMGEVVFTFLFLFSSFYVIFYHWSMLKPILSNSFSIKAYRQIWSSINTTKA